MYDSKSVTRLGLGWSLELGPVSDLEYIIYTNISHKKTELKKWLSEWGLGLGLWLWVWVRLKCP